MKVSVIGLGKRGKQYLENIILNEHSTLDMVYDIDPMITEEMSEYYQAKAAFSLSELCDNSSSKLIIIATPPDQHLSIIEKLSNYNFDILKEKPLANTLEEANKIDKLVSQSNINMMISTQRKFDPLYLEAKNALANLGKIHNIKIDSGINIKNLEAGWRSKSNAGSLVDIGYHYIDIIIWYFGLPKKVQLNISKQNREGQRYQAEDSFNMLFNYNNLDEFNEPIGILSASRVATKNYEYLVIFGTKGKLEIYDRDLRIYDSENNLISHKHFDDRKIRDQYQLDYAVKNLLFENKFRVNDYKQHLEHIQFIEALYNSYYYQRLEYLFNYTKSYDHNKPFSNGPKITKETERVVFEQLYRNISIYNRSDIFEEFENRFASFHDKKFALVTNSGTSALFTAMGAIELKTGDEVIAANYTFFASASPLVFFGAKPIFCDCLEDGNIDPKEIENNISDNTKAVIITHMWGLPCDMEQIMDICNKHNLKLIEDCSHAHGAKYNDKLVGSFGDVACWSLQGAKIISGGEGGVLVTDNEEIYYNSLLIGHYNKRCKQEIPKDYKFSKFSLTGFGLKLRAHPIAIAIANQQFNYLTDWIEQKHKFASIFINEIKNIEFLEVNWQKSNNANIKQPAWYALIILFNPDKAGFDIEEFYQRLIDEGLDEIDRPNSTCPIADLPLFNDMHEVFPDKYEAAELQQNTKKGAFPNSERFYKNALKLAVSNSAEDSLKVRFYASKLKEIATDMFYENNSIDMNYSEANYEDYTDKEKVLT